MTGRISIVLAGCKKALLAAAVQLMQWIMLSAGFRLRSDLDQELSVGSF